jgi:hypothetical protein
MATLKWQAGCRGQEIADGDSFYEDKEFSKLEAFGVGQIGSEAVGIPALHQGQFGHVVVAGVGGIWDGGAAGEICADYQRSKKCVGMKKLIMRMAFNSTAWS